MKGGRSVLTDSALEWRDDAMQGMLRLDMLRYRSGMEGAWGRVYGGRWKYDGNGIGIKENYWAGEAGYDRRYPNNWRAGISLDYRDGKGKYDLAEEATANCMPCRFTARKILPGAPLWI